MPRSQSESHIPVLLMSALETRPAHGYALVEAIRERSEGAFDLAEGTVYPALYRLERKQLVASRWQSVGGRRRRVYRLTVRGRRELARQRAEWHMLARAVGALG
jgi:PadR family transcriptional regulator, regulatory protein PadR